MEENGWLEFIELGRTRGWFWPENRHFLVALIGEEKACKVPLEPRVHKIESVRDEEYYTTGNAEEVADPDSYETEDESEGESSGTNTATDESDRENGACETEDPETCGDMAFDVPDVPEVAEEEVVENIEDAEVPLLDDNVPEIDAGETEEVESDVDYSDDEMDSDGDLQSLMLQEMNQMRQQRFADQTQKSPLPSSSSPSSSPSSSLPSEITAVSTSNKTAEEIAKSIAKVEGLIASLDLTENSNSDFSKFAGNSNEDVAEFAEVAKLDAESEDETPVKVSKKKNTKIVVDLEEEEEQERPQQKKQEADSPQIKVAKRRTGRIIIDSDEDDTPMPIRKPAPKAPAKVIVMVSDDESGSDKENQPAAINRTKSRISKRPSIAGVQPISKTKQILQSARKRFESESEDSGEESEEARGDWIQSDEERSQDEDDEDLSDFVVPDDEVEDDNLDDEEYGEYDECDDSDQEVQNSEDGSEDVNEDFDESEESEEEDSSPIGRSRVPVPSRTPSAPLRTPSAPLRTPSAQVSRTPSRTPAKQPSRKFYSVKSAPKFPVNVPSTPQSSKKRNFDLQIARELYDEYNAKVFGNLLPEDLPLTWSVHLRTTAGVCKMQRRNNVYTASIELALKILDDIDRLKSTLIHEMCHAAVWLIDRSNGGHGREFYTWGNRAERVYPEIYVATCHNYEISYKYTYECSNPTCDVKIGRHSKSLNLERKICKRCHSSFRLAPRMLKDGTPAKPATPSAFSLFLKANLGKTKKANPQTPHKDVMALLVAQYNEMKIAK